MSDRLSELHRQRALLQQHLAWLDREIALASQHGATQRPQISDTTPNPPTATNPLPDEVLDQYRVAPEAVQEDVRKGCFLYFGLAFILLFAVVAILWFAFRRA